MKHFITITALVASIAMAQPNTVRHSEYQNQWEALLSSQLTSFKMDKKLGSAFANLDGGSVVINHSRKVVSISLYKRSHCPKGANCIAMVPAPIMLNFKIVDQGTSDCGVEYLRAESDARHIPGVPNDSVVVYDSSNWSCSPPYTALAETTVVYETSHRTGQDIMTTHSQMDGKALVEIPSAYTDR
jgi:hypothetical protein